MQTYKYYINFDFKEITAIYRYTNKTKKCQKCDARESILSRFYFLDIQFVVLKIKQIQRNRHFGDFKKILYKIISKDIK